MEFNPETNEPFISVYPPHQNLIITPPRITDNIASIEMLNRPEVYNFLVGPPFPYTQQSFDDWLPIIAKATSSALEEYRTAEEFLKSEKTDGEKREKTWQDRKWVGTGGGAPVSCLREVSVDEKGKRREKYIGDISFRRGGEYATITDEDERKKAKAANDALQAGDPKLEWEIGFFLSPPYHGKGIMPVALQTMIEKFAIPHMNVHILNGGYFLHNKASKRVFEKNGFRFREEVENCIELKEVKTGVKGLKAGLGVMRWERQV